MTVHFLLSNKGMFVKLTARLSCKDKKHQKWWEAWNGLCSL